MFSTIELLTNDIQLGAEAQSWLESTVGVALVERSDVECKELINQFLDANARDTDAIAHLQAEIRRRVDGINWIVQMVDQAQAAYDDYQHMESETDEQGQDTHPEGR